MKISIVIPAYNEQGNIGPLLEEVFATVPADILGEVIVVDDGSSDGTAAAVAQSDPRIVELRCVRHVRNSGQSAALVTGMRAARHDIIATLDGDGQNDPADLTALLQRLAAPGTDGPALVGGIRVNRRAGWSKRWASRVANAVRRLVLGDDCPDTGCGIKVMWRDAATGLPAFRGLHRFLPLMFLTHGFQTAYLAVNDRPRRAGVSKYGNINRAIIGLYDLFGVAWLINRAIRVDTLEE